MVISKEKYKVKKWPKEGLAVFMPQINKEWRFLHLNKIITQTFLCIFFGTGLGKKTFILFSRLK